MVHRPTLFGSIFATAYSFPDGGTALMATLNGKVICDSKAIYGGVSTNAGDQGTIAAMQYCTNPTKVKKGDIMTLEANYDLELHPRKRATLSILSLKAFKH
jgi:hypothetical protein